MHTTILICSASLAILTLLLAVWTSIQRGSSKTIAYGAALEPTSAMAKAQRAHGNAAEYAGLLIALFLVVGFAYQGRDLGAVASWTIIAVTVARVIHAIGFLICETLEKPHALKALGALVTYIGGLVLAGLVLSKAL
ncbi:MAG: MAPEG family protein [Henriciella sp.]|nr:MAPEG family protein [Henriciella sp.]